MSTAIIIIFCLAFCTQLVFYLFIFTRLIQYTNNQQKPLLNAKIPVSVIICAKNEEKNLEKHLDSILSQNYSEFEVIVVNDASTDNTSKILVDFKKKYKHLNIVDINPNEIKYLQGKKHALQKGIEKAQYNHLLFTDADCQAVSSNWISHFARAFEQGVELVIGYSPYKEQTGWLNAIIRMDTFFIALQYFSLGILGINYMAVGRNMGYTKQYFNSVNGFEKIGDNISGDDDLIIQKTKKKYHIKYLLHPDSFMISSSKTTLLSWLKQKKRHLSTSIRYKFGHQIVLSIYPLSLIFVYLLVPFIPYPTIVFSLLIIRLIIQQIIFSLAEKKLQTTHMLLSSLIWDFLYSLIYFILAPYYFINKQKYWK